MSGKANPNGGLLVVEGKDEVAFFEAADVKRGMAYAAVSFGGKDNLKNWMQDNFDRWVENLIRESSVQDGLVPAIGFVRDADDDAKAAFDSVKNRLASKFSITPTTSAAVVDTELIAYRTRLRLGILVLPGNSRSGMLETLCAESVSQRPGFSCVDDFVSCAAKNGCPVPSGTKIDKSRALAWLAVQEKPDDLVGVGARAAYWDLSHPCFAPLFTFLNNLFPPPAPTTPSGAPLHA